MLLTRSMRGVGGSSRSVCRKREGRNRSLRSVSSEQKLPSVGRPRPRGIDSRSITRETRPRASSTPSTDLERKLPDASSFHDDGLRHRGTRPGRRRRPPNDGRVIHGRCRRARAPAGHSSTGQGDYGLGRMAQVPDVESHPADRAAARALILASVASTTSRLLARSGEVGKRAFVRHGELREQIAPAGDETVQDGNGIACSRGSRGRTASRKAFPGPRRECGRIETYRP